MCRSNVGGAISRPDRGRRQHQEGRGGGPLPALFALASLAAPLLLMHADRGKPSQFEPAKVPAPADTRLRSANALRKAGHTAQGRGVMHLTHPSCP